jgi:hypothetical protein
MNEKKGWDLTSAHSLEAACWWLGQKAEALIVLVVRMEDQAMRVSPGLAPRDAIERMQLEVRELAAEINRAQRERRARAGAS